MESCCSAKTSPPQSSPPKLRVYLPLLIIFLISLAAAMAVHRVALISTMDLLMAFFLLFLATLKLFDLKGFADSFAGYDVVGRSFKPYAMAYPFFELALSLLYFSAFSPLATNIAMLALMIIGSIGVFRTILSGQAVQCACAGTSFALPVGRVTLLENSAMGAMALINIVTLLV